MRKMICTCDRCKQTIHAYGPLQPNVVVIEGEEFDLCQECAKNLRDFCKNVDNSREVWFMNLLADTEKAICETLGLGAVEAANIPVTVREICEAFKKLADKQNMKIHFK